MNPTTQTMDAMKSALSNPMADDLQKSVNVSTGLTYYDLAAPAKNLYPVLTPLRNTLARVTKQNAGDAAHWKSVTAITGSGFNNSGWVAEGQRTATMSYTTEDKAVNYVTLGEEDNLSFEAEAAGRGFEDLNATVTMRLLQKMMQKEEAAILGGNRTLALGTPTAPTLTNNTSAGAIPAATYNVAVVALTMEGYLNSSVASGVATSTTITGADGNTYTLNGGSSNKSSTASTTLSGTGQVFASTPVVNGAVAYAWYIGTSGAEKLAAITNINSVNLTALNGSGQALSAISADCSRNSSLAFDGLATSVFSAGAASNAYVRALATGTAGTGTTLTSNGAGGITEIDAMLKAMWDNYKVSPDTIYVSSQELKNISNKVLNSSSSPLLRYNSGNGDNGYDLTANGVISAYYNPFAVNGGAKIKLELQPNLAPGTVLAYSKTLPAHYQSNQVPNVAEMLCRRDYYRIDWPLRTRRREYGVYAEEALAVYAPFAMGIITNIANG